MSRQETLPKEVRYAVSDALELLKATEGPFNLNDDNMNPDPLPSLLEQCGEFASLPMDSEPIRLIHHFACTGGTLITKCLACSPNLHVLSEVDPLTALPPAGSKFAPTDILRLAESSNRSLTTEEKIQVFMASFRELYRHGEKKGLRLLVRDHAHSHFCTGNEIPKRPTVAEIVARGFDTRSIVTVRHPLDSYLSLHQNRWSTFQPFDLEEYANRYRTFLTANGDARVFKYEDFLSSPGRVMQKMCTELEISFQRDFQDLFMVHGLSGDSGRKGSVIKSRERRPVPEHIEQERSDSPAYKSLCEELEYQV
jgi:hypothetical protein